MRYHWSFAPATADIAGYDALRADLAASGEEGLQVENLKASPMRSRIGLYALLHMLREDGGNDCTRLGIIEMLHPTAPVPMLHVIVHHDWERTLNQHAHHK